MRPLSEAQARACENAQHPKCKCRCGGALHGAFRAGSTGLPDRAWFTSLPKEDPHWLPEKPDALERLTAKGREKLTVLKDKAVKRARERCVKYRTGVCQPTLPYFDDFIDYQKQARLARRAWSDVLRYSCALKIAGSD